MILEIFLFILGLILLVKGSGYFVKSAAAIAKRLGVSEFVIGLTLVAVGTSIPELASSIAASLKQSSGLIIGNVVGSNIANVCLIIGIAATITVMKTKKDMLKRDGYIMVFVSLLLFVFIFNGRLSKIEAGILLVLYFAYIMFLFEMKPQFKGKYGFREFFTYFYQFKYLTTIKSKLLTKKVSKAKRKEAKKLFTWSFIKDSMILILGGIAIILGAKFLVEEAIFFANLFNIPNTLIGISVIAIGTSLPELTVSISAARKGLGNIAVGNIIGSNIANILLILGVSSLIAPLEIMKATIYYSVPFMVLTSALLLFFIKSNWEIRRREGIFFLILYVIFMTLLFIGLIS